MIEKTMEVDRMEDVISVFGSFDQNLRMIETEYNVRVTDRDEQIHITGEAENVLYAEKAIAGLLSLAAKGEEIGEQNVRYIFRLVREGGMKQAELRQLLREHRYEELQFASSCALSHRRTLLVLKTPDNSTFHTYDLMRRNALRLQAALAERTAGATTLYLTMRPMNFYEFRRFLQNNPDVFERKYFLPEDALILLERIPPRSTPVPRLDRPTFEALLDAGDADGAEAFVRQLYAALTDCADLRALLSCSQELYFALAHRAEALPEHTAWNTPDDRAQWRSAACIGRWLTEKTRALLAALAP